MKIITKGKGIPKWSFVESIYVTPELHSDGTLTIKLDSMDAKHQWVVAFNARETKELRKHLSQEA